MNWRGQVLRTYEAIINLISNTTSRGGLVVRARLDRRRYRIGNLRSRFIVVIDEMSNSDYWQNRSSRDLEDVANWWHVVSSRSDYRLLRLGSTVEKIRLHRSPAQARVQSIPAP